MIEIKVHLFAHLKQKAGTSLAVLNLPEQSTVLDLKNELVSRFPSLQGQLKSMVALENHSQIRLDEEILLKTSEITIIPPIGGG
ncbi:MAG: MoaD/ThiS family protein [Anaerolineaceae bacterium]|nr:MoaD/ThiS family protein [Anaerolineaceae bacterium]